MTMRSLSVALILLAFANTQVAWGGYYNSIDSLEESRMSHDYENVFAGVLQDLREIRLNDQEVRRDTPMRRRYLFIEKTVREPKIQLDTLEQKLTFSAVWIRRGRAVEAAQLLRSLADENPDNFLVLTQYATALFLTNEREFEVNAPFFMKKALKKWPLKWSDVKDEEKQLLKAFGWDETAFERNRRNEVYFERLMVNRLKEKRLREKKEAVPDTVDPIFLDADEKPIRFLNENGQFEAGRIAEADKKQLPHYCIEAVEQLLIWMPTDERLHWLLAETLNAIAKDYQGGIRDQKIRSAYTIVARLTNPLSPASYGLKELKSRHDALDQYVANIREPDINIPDDPWISDLWKRTFVGFVAGLAVGIFALWQVQEMRRRRQGRR